MLYIAILRKGEKKRFEEFTQKLDDIHIVNMVLQRPAG